MFKSEKLLIYDNTLYWRRCQDLLYYDFSASR